MADQSSPAVAPGSHPKRKRRPRNHTVNPPPLTQPVVAPSVSAPPGRKQPVPPPPPAKIKRNAPPLTIRKWWHSLRDVDPITLVPLKHLSFPPFELSVSDSTVKHYFDSEALALYLCQTGKFVNPINRQALLRSDCLRLDNHLRMHGKVSKCVEMMDLQNNINKGDVRTRGEVSVIASQLFQYPPLLPTRSTSRSGLQVLDDDEFLIVGGSGPLMVEDDFPAMPVVRRPTQASDFPPLSRTDNTATAWTCPMCTLENVSSSRNCAVCLANRPREVVRVDASETSSNAGVSEIATPSWRRAPGQPDPPPPERPRLVLAKKSSSSLEALPVRSSSIFGKAFPVNGIRNAVMESLPPPPPEALTVLCPYSSKLLRQAKGFGFSFVSYLEKKFVDLIHVGHCRQTISLEPMGESKRFFARELAARYYGLHCVETDPEPKRFLQISSLPTAFVPEISLSKAMMWFPQVVHIPETIWTGPGLLLLGCSAPTTGGQLSHFLVRDLHLRESEFDLFWLDSFLDEKVCFVSLVNVERARRTYIRWHAISSSHLCRKLVYWPCGVEWARAQIRIANSKPGEGKRELGMDEAEENKLEAEEDFVYISDENEGEEEWEQV